MYSPDVVDVVQPADLGEEPGVGDVGSDLGAALDATRPVVAPVVHATCKTQGTYVSTLIFPWV